MKLPQIVAFLVMLGSFFAFAENDAPPKVTLPATHQWKNISYPTLTPWRQNLLYPRIEIVNSNQLQFNFTYNLPSDNWQKANGKVEPEKVEVSLYRNDDKPISLKGRFSEETPMGSGPELEERHHFCSHSYDIPWGKNVMEEAWIAVRLKDRTFWVEVPYGFTRNPADPLPERITKGKPVFPKLEAPLGPKDCVVPWEYVRYQLADYPNFISLHLANPFDTTAEVLLEVAGSDVREPYTTLTIVAAEDWRRKGLVTALSLKEGSARSQIYKFARTPAGARFWGSIELGIGKETRACVIPSSVFEYVHGHAELPNGAKSVQPDEKWPRGSLD